MSDMYPWTGDYRVGNEDSPVAVVTLADEFVIDKKRVAIWGPMKTENLGIEKVIVNVISNPNIRFLIICGKEIRGHRSGSSLLALHNNGIEENGKIKDSPGAVPYIENISEEAVDRFREQVEIYDLIGETDENKISQAIGRAYENDPGSFGEPFTAIEIKEEKGHKFQADLALHAAVTVTTWGEISPMEE